MNDRTRQFESLAPPHLDAAYNLARWLLRDDRDAEDVVQEAYLRAFRFFDSLRNADARAWLLSIVRRTCYDWLDQRKLHGVHEEFDEFADLPWDAHAAAPVTPEAQVASSELNARVNAALGALPPLFREVIVLRKLEELSYEDIARIVGVPVGTVMSRLSRARARLRERLEPIRTPGVDQQGIP